jgi:hypothetical protein
MGLRLNATIPYGPNLKLAPVNSFTEITFHETAIRDDHICEKFVFLRMDE